MMNFIGLKRFFTIGCICMMAFADFGCGRNAGQTQHDDATLSIYFKGDERALGPDFIGPWYLVFLTISTLDESGNDLPQLMERWEHTPDYKDWTAHFRKDIKWDDGVPLTAEDVKFSLELWTSPGIYYERGDFEPITLVDDYTLQISFKKANNFTVPTYGWLPILPKHILKDHDRNNLFDWEFWKQPIGNGPYRYVRHVPQTMVEVEANPNYYKESPKIKRVILRFGGNQLTELQSGNVDIVTDISPIESIILAKDARFRVYHDIKFRNNSVIVWNHRNPLFSDSEVRKALTMAINRRELHALLNLPSDIPIFDVGAMKRHHFGGIVPEPLPFDPERAKLLLDKAGWIDENKDGIREKDGREFRFTMITPSNLSSEAIFVQDKLRRVGIKVEVGSMERRFLNQKVIQENDFEAAIGFFERTDYGRLRYFHAAGYENPDFYRFGSSAWNTITKEEEDFFYKKIWAMQIADMPVTYLHPQTNFKAAHHRVKGLRNNSHMDLFSSIEHLWIEEEE